MANNTVSMAELEHGVKIQSHEDAVLASLGKKGELERVYGFWTREIEIHLAALSRMLIFVSVLLPDNHDERLVMPCGALLNSI